MKLLMISADKKIMDETSEVFERMRSYASVCDELHVVVLCNGPDDNRSYGNLFIYPAVGNKIIQRISCFRVAREVMRSHAIDMITAQSPDEIGLIAYMIAQAFFVPLQLQVHTDIMSPWYRRAGPVPWIKYMVARFLLPRAQCIRVVSRRIAQSLIKELHISESLISIIPVFTDVDTFARATFPVIKDARLRDSDCAVITVGRFVDKEKNFSMLIRAMRDVVAVYSKAVLIIVGEGPDRGRYESLIIELGLKDHVCIEPWRDDLASFYKSFDLFVLPSYIEGWGRAVIEAMAAGLPIVMSDVGVAGEVVKDGVNGKIVPVGEQSALGNVLITLCKNPDMRKAYGKAAREAVLKLKPDTQEAYLEEWKKSFDCCTLVK